MKFPRLAVLLAVGAVLFVPVFADDALPPASVDHLPRWRGFNLQNKFFLTSAKPFAEEDFEMIHELGFNFVRLPMDYRIWIKNGDWTQIDETAAFHDLDQAVAWGEKYHVHICLNFHRAPGYTVAKPPEAKSLWTDDEAQRVCAMHWAAFARHFKGIPSERLSFDLFNEPPDIDPQVYAKVVGIMVDAIRQEDPSRLIIADGLAWGNKPCPELAPLHIAQATRGYQPMQITHYKASWIENSDNFPAPNWPLTAPAYTFLYGPGKGDLHTPLVLTGMFPANTVISLNVGTVSSKSKLVVRADDQVVFSKSYESGPVSKEGEKVVLIEKYNSYQNVFNQKLDVTLPRNATKLTFSNDKGDWLTITSLDLKLADGKSASVQFATDWGKPQPALALNFDNGPAWTSPDTAIDREWLWQHDIVPWQNLQKQGVGVMVGEWGCFNKTPYDVTLRWMEDNLANFKRADWGWALWCFEGSFGILDSERPGAVYEDFHGHKLDRRMLELLRKY